MSTIRILHLSDLQFGKKNRFNNDTSYSNIETFAKSIANEVINSFKKIPPDMIVVTGDIAHTASKKEYKDAVEFFNKLFTEFKMYGKQPSIYIVPGNHDLDSDKTELGKYLFSWGEIPGNDNGQLIDFLEQKFDIDWVKTAKIEKIHNCRTIKVSTEKKSILLKLNNEQTKLNIEIDDVRTDELIAKTENETLKIYLGTNKEDEFVKKFFHYNLFIENFFDSRDLCTEYDHPYYVSKACDDKILIIGLNSAINITKSDNHAEISLKQINSAIQEIEKNSETFKIAIVHHNFTRNSDNDETNIRDADKLQHLLIDAKIQLLLHGHQHLAGAELRRSLVNGNQIFILSTGSASVKPPRPDIDVQNQFQLITLELESTIKVSVNRKVFSVQPNEHGKWISDISKAKDGIFHFFIYDEKIRDIIEAIQKITDCQICSKTPAIHFSNGFETSPFYNILLKNTKKRLWIFGRKNRKLFETEVERALDEFLKRQKEESLDFRVLFISPDAPENIICKAHADSDFLDRLNVSINRARETCKENDIEFDKVCKFYHKERCMEIIIIDDAVLFRTIKTDLNGKVEHLTDMSFDIVSSDSEIGKDLVHNFEETWFDKSVNPLKYSMNILQAANIIGIEDILLRKVEQIEAGKQRYQDQIKRAISDQFDKKSGKIQIYCVAAKDLFDKDISTTAQFIYENLENSQNKCALEVLILCPSSDAKEIRNELEPDHGLKKDIESSLDRLRYLHKKNPNKVNFKLYDLIPSVLLIITDDLVFVETYPMHMVDGKVDSIGGKLPMLIIRKMTREGIESETYRIWKAHFDYAWNNFSHNDDEKTCTLKYKKLRRKV
jgi:3',5'-cyclic AMP phosphodiesterase CpdA